VANDPPLPIRRLPLALLALVALVVLVADGFAIARHHRSGPQTALARPPANTTTDPATATTTPANTTTTPATATTRPTVTEPAASPEPVVPARPVLPKSGGALHPGAGLALLVAAIGLTIARGARRRRAERADATASALTPSRSARNA
jgi:hypothetical protein